MGDAFNNLLEVVKFLQGEGFKISRSGIYKHSSEGKIVAGEDGKYSREKVLKYAESWLKRLDGSRKKDELRGLQKRKLIAETDRIQAVAKRERKKLEILTGQYISMVQHEKELADRAILFKSDLENFARGRAHDLVVLVGGSEERTPELIEFLLEAFDDFLDRYSRKAVFTLGEG